MTVHQSKALRKLWNRLSADGRGQWGAYSDPRGAYKAFRKSAFRAFGNCVMVKWSGMLIGIEADGYTHS
jgi:hypothetical protein